MRRTGICFALLLCITVLAPVIEARSREIGLQGLETSPLSADVDRTIKLEIVIKAPIDKVWWAWTTRDGIKSFFAPDCDLDLRVLGKYDILFAPSAPVGRRGAEGNLVLAIQEGRMLSFTWDAPPTFPEIRKQRTSVVIRLLPIDQNTTHLLFRQSGWGDSEDWTKAHDYFEGAWGDVVLPRLKHSLEVGPLDWKNPPQKLEKAKRT
jgi:uncharacterized protein YndB with AHSA1/START domain